MKAIGRYWKILRRNYPAVILKYRAEVWLQKKIKQGKLFGLDVWCECGQKGWECRRSLRFTAQVMRCNPRRKYGCKEWDDGFRFEFEMTVYSHPDGNIQEAVRNLGPWPGMSSSTVGHMGIWIYNPNVRLEEELEYLQWKAKYKVHVARQPVWTEVLGVQGQTSGGLPCASCLYLFSPISCCWRACAYS